ncbi:MAG: TetR/AcrR family transcriptional regulator [Spirochaetales bacterium]|nr:TetR/AcrR family transcriptional regulator [Spirochaetales bacterium]
MNSTIKRTNEHMTEKQLRRKQEIIDTAFKVWGKSSFRNTSLASIAQELGISKTALYRYFSGKEELLNAMEQAFIQLYQEIAQKVIHGRTEDSFVSAMNSFNTHFVAFFADHPYYLSFAQIHFLNKSEIGGLLIDNAASQFQNFFPEKIFNALAVSRKQIPAVTRYIVTVASFLLVTEGCTKMALHPPADQPGSAEAVSFAAASPSEVPASSEELIEINSQWVLNGFAGSSLRHTDAKISHEAFQTIEKECMIRNADIPETNRIFKAVSSVVAEDGLFNATVERVAKQLGMSKSSLYFYFENRDQMLWEIINRERHTIGRMIQERVNHRNYFPEQLYAYFVLFVRYMWERPEILAAMNWYRFQEFDFTPPQDPISDIQHYYDFIDKAREQGICNTEEGPGISLGMVVRFMNFFLMQEITRHYRLGKDLPQLFPVLRTLHSLFLYGIEGA